MDISPYLGTIVSIIITAAGTYAAFSTRLTKLETSIENLFKNVDKQSVALERVYKLESDTNTMWKRIDELKSDIKDLQR